MFWFWIIFIVISMGFLVSAKKASVDAVRYWDTDDPEKLIKIFQTIHILVGIFLTSVGILGLLEYITP